MRAKFTVLIVVVAGMIGSTIPDEDDDQFNRLFLEDRIIEILKQDGPLSAEIRKLCVKKCKACEGDCCDSEGPCPINCSRCYP